MNMVLITLETLSIIATAIVTVRFTVDVTVKSLRKTKMQANCTQVMSKTARRHKEGFANVTKITKGKNRTQHSVGKTITEQIEEINQGADHLFQQCLTFTAKEIVTRDCLICAKKMRTVKVIPIPENLATCEVYLCKLLTPCVYQACVPLCLNHDFDPTLGGTSGLPHDPSGTIQREHIYSCQSVAYTLTLI